MAGPGRPRLGQWPLTVVLLVAAAGLVDIGFGHFKRGTVVFAAAVLLSALLRAVLPTRAAGLLAVRSRGLDVAVAVVLGVAIVALVVIVPPFGFAGY